LKAAYALSTSDIFGAAAHADRDFNGSIVIAVPS
jgi:hypothetical protein